jgi:uncharacterized damage-inducible protein DinB
MPSLSMSSIGEHVRHILDMFICLERAYADGYLNYDLRDRDEKIQCIPASAEEMTNSIIHHLNKEDKVLTVKSMHFTEEVTIQSSYSRELLYCIEHCIHHQALIRVALKEMGLENLVPSSFGVAPSTLAYQAYVHR